MTPIVARDDILIPPIRPGSSSIAATDVTHLPKRLGKFTAEPLDEVRESLRK
jgi:hypothetical protein